jgi:hypothetical protein
MTPIEEARAAGSVRTCIAPGCDKRVDLRTFECRGHRERREKHGTYGDGPLKEIRPRGLSMAESLSWYGWDESASGCWEFRGSRDNDGYGQMWFEAKSIRAHRASYLTNHGQIPRGMVVRHKCDNRICVNPAHLEVGTAGDNNRDRAARGRSAKTRTLRRDAS